MAADRPVLDEAHLARQTFGDKELEREVLELFTEQLRRLSASLEAADGAERDALLHGLKGSARAVGAMALAQVAEDLEGNGAARLDELQGVMAETLRALRGRLK